MTRKGGSAPRLPGLGGDGKVARVRRSVDAQLTAQRRMGQLEAVDEGLVGLARTLADVMDREVVDPDGSAYTVGNLAGRLLPVLLELRGTRLDADAGGVDAELVQLAAAFRDAARSRPPDAGP